MRAETDKAKRQSRIVLTILGALVGGGALHTVSMIGYHMTLDQEFPTASAIWGWISMSVSSCMFPMITFYAVLGGTCGFMTALFLERRIEIERRKATQETLEDLTMTVAHYVRNANSVVGGYARRLLDTKECSDSFRSKIELIRNASDRIEAVVASIQELTPDSRSEEVGKSHIRMLDLNTALKRKIDQIDKTPAMAATTTKD